MGTITRSKSNAALADNIVTSAKIVDGTIVDADINDVAASKLTGALPAISGANLTGISTGTSWQSVVTGATLTAVAGNGYPINTTSNACTITLPGSASVGDFIEFTDYARTWGTNKIILDSNGLNYQGWDDTFNVEYTTNGQSVHIVYMDATNGWIPIEDDDVANAPLPRNSEGIFAYGSNGGDQSISNLVSNIGVVSADVTGVGTARGGLAACEYGGDKGIFGYGSGYTAVTNLVTNAGVVGTDVTGVGTARRGLGACDYGGDKGIFGFGTTGSYTAVSNLVSNAGVVGTDVTGVGTAREMMSACEYGGNKGIFGFGYTGSNHGMTNLVSNVGVVATDVTAVGTARRYSAACSYGLDKGIFGYGYTDTTVGMTNLVSNSGVVASDVAVVGSVKNKPAATQYGNDKGIFAYGTGTSVSNLVSNIGVVSTNVTGVGTARDWLGGCSFN
jgi:hypothetical protein